MSLAAPDSGRRARSRSPGRIRDRSPARSRAQSPEYREEQKPKYEYAESKYEYASPKYDYAESKYEYASPSHASEAPQQTAMPSPYPPYSQTSQSQFDHRQPSHISTAQPSYAQPRQYEHEQVSTGYAGSQPYYQQGQPHSPPSGPGNYARPNEYAHGHSENHPSYASPGQYQYAQTEDRSGRPPTSGRPEHERQLSFSTSANINMKVGGGHGQSQTPHYAAAPDYAYAQPQSSTLHHEPQGSHSTGRHSISHGHASTAGPEYAKPVDYHYAQPDEKIGYTYNKPQPKVEYIQKRPQDASIVEVRPGGGVLHAPPSPGLGARMHSLSVSGMGAGAGALSLGLGHGHGHSGGAPPGSPLLEAYHGTYQSISPMPSPMMLATNVDDDLDDLTPLSGHGSSDDEDGRYRRDKKKRVKFYDPEENAKDLAEALRHRNVDAEPLIQILPRLTHDHMLQLRNEYKKHAKVQGKGINIAKQIKMKIGTTAFGKVCYATALGRWESEAYWANFWYQSNTSRRELLIESLMGRTNAEIREIKEAFSDKRYNDSLEKCMKAELKADKFRTAVLLVLDEKRQEDSNYVYADAVRDDVRKLHDALVAREGGETAMIHIIVTRSDTQIREVLKNYEKTYGKNFGREMLRKSTNLVVKPLPIPPPIYILKRDNREKH